jgi:hypothetical protein
MKYIFLLALFVSECSSNTITKNEIELMKTEYQIRYGQEPDLWPVIIGTNENFIEIFSVPIENAIGTNSLNNAITLLKFMDDKIVYDEMRRDFIEGVDWGDKCYLGVFSDSWIGYTQTRGLLLFDLKTKNFKRFVLSNSISTVISKVQVFDSSKYNFLFQFNDHFHNMDSDSNAFGERTLRLINLNDEMEFEDISQMGIGVVEIGYAEPWDIHNKTIFVYRRNSENGIAAYDMYFNPIEHPFCDLFNNLDGFRRLDQLVIHPNLPIALIVEMDKTFRKDYKVYIANWSHPDTDQRFVELLSQQISIFSDWSNIKNLYVSDFQFSPDGKWLVFRDDSEMVLQDTPNPTFIAMPVDGSREMPLGKPKVLGKVMRENASPSSTAWITKPLSFVVSDDQVLYKWELDKLKREFKE